MEQQRLSSSEEIKLDTAPAVKRHSGIFIAAVTLLALAAACHLWLFASLLRLLPRSDISDRLIAAVLPEYRIALREIDYRLYEAEILPPKSEDSDSEYITKSLACTSDYGRSLSNQTAYSPDLEALYAAPSPIDRLDKLYERYMEGEPVVLVYHTHATESYRDTNDTGTFRSPDPKRNVTSVGEVLCRTLEKLGVPSAHITEPFDLESYNDAYYNSSAAVADFLEGHPSVQYVIDLHRDCVMSSDGKYISALSDTGRAQLMFVVGTNEGGSNHTEWQKNLTVTLQLQARLWEGDTSLMRPINLRAASFYQHTSPGAMLIEFGSCGNTLAEAKRSAVALGISLAEYITGNPSALSADILEAELCK